MKHAQKQIFAFVFVFLSVSMCWAQGGAIYLHQVNNYYPGYIPNWVAAGEQLNLKIGVSNNSGGTVTDIHGCFEIYSPDGASWQPVIGSWTSTVGSWFDGSNSVYIYSTPGGMGTDSVLFAGFNIFGAGLQNGVSTVAWTITTSVDISQVGRHICIDSVFSIQGKHWLWSTTIGGLSPAWDGPHCFTIESDCCQDVRGDVNGDGVNSNILDLTYLVNLIFRSGPPPPCALEADLNGDGVLGNIQDLTYLINFKWRGGPAGVSCP